jgi:hypothetical protein
MDGKIFVTLRLGKQIHSKLKQKQYRDEEDSDYNMLHCLHFVPQLLQEVKGA